MLVCVCNKQLFSDRELVFDNEVLPDVTSKQGEKLNAEFKPEYCMIAPGVGLRSFGMRYINAPER